MIIFLDTGVLGKITNPNLSPETIECQTWFERLLARGVYFVSSEICFYELKRSLILTKEQQKSSQGIENLDNLRNTIDFLTITKDEVEIAARIWAEARKTFRFIYCSFTVARS